MTPFQKVPVSPLATMMKRHTLYAQPDEFFAPFFNGRSPSLQEKMQYIECAVQRLSSLNVWENDTYRVEVAYHAPYIQLNISRHDGAACTCWREFQKIKNELVGPEFEAIELFPAESRLVDTANQYHLWVYADPKFRFPVGFVDRFVLEKPVKMEPCGSADQTLDGVAPQAKTAPPQMAVPVTPRVISTLPLRAVHA
jgi:hypothetical protein